MIAPATMIQALLTKLNAAKADLKITVAVEGSEDLKENQLIAPYIILFESFEDDADISTDGTAHDLSVTINVLYVGRGCKNVHTASSEAFNAAIKIIKLLKGEYLLKNLEDEDEFQILRSKPRPFTVKNKSAALTAIIAHFEYPLDIIL